MAKSVGTGVIIAIVVFILIAAAIRMFGGPLYDMLVEMHGGGGH